MPASSIAIGSVSAAFSLSVFLVKESNSALKLAGVVLIVVGLALLRTGKA